MRNVRDLKDEVGDGIAEFPAQLVLVTAVSSRTSWGIAALTVAGEEGGQEPERQQIGSG